MLGGMKEGKGTETSIWNFNGMKRASFTFGVGSEEKRGGRRRKIERDERGSLGEN